MYKKGTIVLIPFPFTDLSGNKVRPALIVSNIKAGRDVVVVFITSQKNVKGNNLVTLVPDSQNRLKTTSKIVCGKIATLDTKIVLGEIGQITSLIQKKVDLELSRVLGLE